MLINFRLADTCTSFGLRDLRAGFNSSKDCFFATEALSLATSLLAVASIFLIFQFLPLGLFLLMCVLCRFGFSTFPLGFEELTLSSSLLIAEDSCSFSLCAYCTPFFKYFSDFFCLCSRATLSHLSRASSAVSCGDALLTYLSTAFFFVLFFLRFTLNFIPFFTLPFSQVFLCENKDIHLLLLF